MIKLIATDLDGTLLDEEKRLPEKIFGLIEQLHERGILFAPASGRQYANLKELFFPVWEKLVFLCENGALVKYRDETLYLDPVPIPAVRQAIAQIRAIPRLFPMICGVDCTYIESDKEPFYSYALRSYTRCALVNDLDEVIGREPVCKIAIFDELPAAQHCYALLPQRLPHLRTILSGDDWCDVSVPTADKGAAMRFVRGYFGLKKEECVSFGDQMNDLEMLLECGHAFLPENAYPPLKERFLHTVPSNAEGGVLRKIEEILQTGGIL